MSVNVYIKENVESIAKKDIYIVPGIPEKKLNNVIKAYKCEEHKNSILAIYDNTLLGSAKEGLVFTGERLLYNNNGDLVEFLYKDINSVKYIKDTVVNNSEKEEVEHYVLIEMSGKNYKLEKLGTFNYQKFVDLLSSIIDNFDEYVEEDQLKTIADMSDEFKKAYLKIIVNMTYIDDEEIDEKELAEILLLMTRLELSKDIRFDIRTYITEISHENLVSIEDLISTIKENSESSHFQSLMISLAKDLINTYFSTQTKEEINIIVEKILGVKALDKDGNPKDINMAKASDVIDYIGFAFLENNQNILSLSNKEIFLAYSTIANDYALINNDLDDDKIKENAKDLAAKATAAGAPLAAVYISGSVLGMSAAGITSGLATLGMGMGMTGGLVVVGLIGIMTYKGLKHLTGANELDKYKTRELMLHEVIKQTQKTISLIIDDINFVVQKLNDVTLNHTEQSEKIKKLVQMMAKYQSAIKTVDNKTNYYQNSANRLLCPKELDVSRLESLTIEPTQKPLFDFIIENYEERSIKIDGKQKKSIILKDNIDTETLDKMGEVFKSLGYFDMGNIVKGKASEGLGKLKKGIFG